MGRGRRATAAWGAVALLLVLGACGEQAGTGDERSGKSTGTTRATTITTRPTRITHNG